MRAGQGAGLGLLVLAACGASTRPPPGDVADAGDAEVGCTDRDGDRQQSIACGGLDCDDDDPERHAGARDPVDGRDQNCDGVDGYDEDGDRWAAGAGDCDDGHAAVSPRGSDLWDTEVVDDSGDVGSFPGLVLDDDGAPHAAYFVGVVFDVRAATRGDVDWVVTELPDAPSGGCESPDGGYRDQGFGLAMTAGPDGARHVTFLGWYQAQVRHATDASGTWEVDEVATVGVCDVAGCGCGTFYDAPDTSVAVSPDGSLHVAYPAQVGGDLSHAQLHVASGRPGNYVIETVTPPQDDAGTSNAIGVGPDGRVTVAYRSETFDEVSGIRVPGLWVAERGPESWEPVEVDVEGDAGVDVALAFAPDGTLHLAYHDRALSALRHARRDPDGTWALETVDREGNPGKQVSLAVDARGTVHLSYFVEDTSEVVYATDVGGVWSRRTIALGGPWSAIALDRAGVPNVLVYQDAHAVLVRPHLDGIDGDCNGVDW